MGGMFSKPKIKTSPAPADKKIDKKIEEPQKVVEDEEEVKRKRRVALSNRGRVQNLLSGIQSALKQRLGE